MKPLHFTSRITFLLSAFLSMAGCTKKEIENIYILQSPEKKGSVQGYVKFVSRENQLMTDMRGVNVRLEGIVPEIAVVTDSLGHYRLDSISMGTYTLVFEKAGYAPEKRDFTMSTPGGNAAQLIEDGQHARRNWNGAKIFTWLYELPRSIAAIPTIIHNLSFDTLRPNSGELFRLEGTYSRSDTLMSAPEGFTLYYDTLPGVTNLNTARKIYGSGRYGKYILNQWNGSWADFRKGRTYYGKIYSMPSYPLTWIHSVTGITMTLSLEDHSSPEFQFIAKP